MVSLALACTGDGRRSAAGVQAVRDTAASHADRARGAAPAARLTSTATVPAVASTGPAASASPGDSVRRIALGLPAGYARLRDSLRAVTRVPLVLPTRMLGDQNDDSVYVLVEDADSTSYSVYFSPSVSCQGGSSCRFGTAGGAVRPAPLGELRGRRVRLADGRAAVYTEGECNVGCADNELTWAVGKYSYYVGLKRGRLADLVKMAESAAPVP